MAKKAISAREAILEAAAALAAEGGVAALGVEQVNKRAGVSKGAFFYHFKTKDEMIHALVEHVSSAFVAGLAKKRSKGARFTDALVDMTLQEVRQRGPLISALIAAVYLDRSIGDRVKEQVGEWTKRMIRDDELTPERALVVRLCLDGLMLSTLLYDSSHETDYFRAVEKAIKVLVAEKL